MEILNDVFKALKINVTNNTSNLLLSLSIFITGIIFTKIIKKVIENILSRIKIDKSISNYISYTLSIVFLLFIIMISLSILGIPTSTLVSILAVLGVSFGVAFKTTLENLGSGFIILFFKPFQSGDYIESEGIEGNVIDTHVFSTTLKTFDNKTIIIPNSKLTTQSIINYTKQDKRRIDIILKLPYNTDIVLAKELLKQIFETQEFIINKESSRIEIRNFKENGIEMLATSWVKTEDYWNTFFSLTSKIEKSFRINNIDMHIPQKILYQEKYN